MTLLLLATCPAEAAHICSDTGVIVMGSDQDEARQACRAARTAKYFFADLGLTLPRKVKVLLLGRMLGGAANAEELGRYDGRQRAIQVLNFDAARKMARHDVPGLGVAMDRALWRSYIVHELTHAAIHAGCDRSCPDRASHEYIAAVAQIATLPDPVRSKMLRHHHEVAAFDKASEISEIYYALSPCRFAVKSYLHYRQPENGPAFIRRLLNQDKQAARAER